MTAKRSASWQINVTEDGVIHSRFTGPTPSDEIAQFTEALTARMPAARARLVFDLRELGAYNAETKAPMKAWLLEHKLAILELTVLVPKSGAMLKVVVAAIALATGVKIRIREDLEDAARVLSP